MNHSEVFFCRCSNAETFLLLLLLLSLLLFIRSEKSYINTPLRYIHMLCLQIHHLQSVSLILERLQTFLSMYNKHFINFFYKLTSINKLNYTRELFNTTYMYM